MPYILGLPDELFEAIFDLFRPTMSSDWAELLMTKTWWSIPAVCRRWRQIVIHYPPFWTHILLHNTELTTTMLERSKVAPLIVSCNTIMHGPEVGDNLLSIIPQAHRFAELEVVCLMRTVEVLASELASFPAPLLTKLSISCMGSEHEELPILPAGIFNGSTPHLSHFSLNGCRTPWTAPLFQESLTFLHLDDIQPLDTHGISAMIDALTVLVNLEHLTLLMVQPRRRELVRVLSGHLGERKVVLPRLTSLYAVGIITDVVHLINLLILPSDAFIRLNMRHVPELETWTTTQATLYQTFSGHLASLRCDAIFRSRDGPIRTLQLACRRSVFSNDEFTFEIRTSRSLPPRDTRAQLAWKENSDLNKNNMDILTILPPSLCHSQAIQSLTSKMLEALLPSAVEHFVVQPATQSFTEGWWQTLSACMPNLRAISVQGNPSTLSLSRCLGMPTQPFTRLTELALECVDFCDPAISGFFVQAAERRHFRRLSIRWCDITRPVLSHLQRQFEQVTWDEKETGRSEALRSIRP